MRELEEGGGGVRLSPVHLQSKKLKDVQIMPLSSEVIGAAENEYRKVHGHGASTEEEALGALRDALSAAASAVAHAPPALVAAAAAAAPRPLTPAPAGARLSIAGGRRGSVIGVSTRWGKLRRLKIKGTLAKKAQSAGGLDEHVAELSRLLDRALAPAEHAMGLAAPRSAACSSRHSERGGGVRVLPPALMAPVESRRQPKSKVPSEVISIAYAEFERVHQRHARNEREALALLRATLSDGPRYYEAAPRPAILHALAEDFARLSVNHARRGSESQLMSFAQQLVGEYEREAIGGCPSKQKSKGAQLFQAGAPVYLLPPFPPPRPSPPTCPTSSTSGGNARARGRLRGGTGHDQLGTAGGGNRADGRRGIPLPRRGGVRAVVVVPDGRADGRPLVGCRREGAHRIAGLAPPADVPAVAQLIVDRGRWRWAFRSVVRRRR